MKLIYFSLSLVCLSLVSCGSEKPSETNSETSIKKNSEASTTTPTAESKNSALKLDTLEDVVTSQLSFLNQLNAKLISLKTAENANAAIPELKKFVEQSAAISEARKKFPELEKESKIPSTKEAPMVSLAMKRQSLNFTMRAKKKREDIYPIIKEYLDQILINTPNPHGFIGDDK